MNRVSFTGIYTANVLTVNSTFYFCVKNPPTVSCDFSRYLSVVYQDQYFALFTEKYTANVLVVKFTDFSRGSVSAVVQL